MDFVSGLRCRECARTYPAEALHVCDFCFGPLEVVYDYEAVRAARHPGVHRRGPADHLALRPAPAGGRPVPRSTSARDSRRWCAPTGWPPSWDSASCG